MMYSAEKLKETNELLEKLIKNTNVVAQLVLNIKNMRKYQKLFFETPKGTKRDKFLQQSKMYEQQVDKQLKEVTEPKLFLDL